MIANDTINRQTRPLAGIDVNGVRSHLVGVVENAADQTMCSDRNENDLHSVVRDFNFDICPFDTARLAATVVSQCA